MTQLPHAIHVAQTSQVPNLPRPPQGVWWLFGTEGCHLCDEAYRLIQIANRAYLVPPVVRQDIMTLPNDLMKALALRIPVLVSQKGELYWRFGLADVVALSERT